MTWWNPWATIRELRGERDSLLADYITLGRLHLDVTTDLTTLRAELATAHAGTVWLSAERQRMVELQADNARLRGKLARPKMRGAKRNTPVPRHDYTPIDNDREPGFEGDWAR